MRIRPMPSARSFRGALTNGACVRVLSMSNLIGAILLGAPFVASAGTWQRLTNQPRIPDIIDPATNIDYGSGGASAPLLLTDGSVLVQDAGVGGEDAKIFKLTPNIKGSYVNGTWSQLASKPYIGSVSAQAVLKDGRVIIEGGEYTGYGYDFTLTNQGAIYDPVANAWTSVAPPSFFVDLYPPRALFAPNPIGDAASVVLPDGTFMLADKTSHQAALLNLDTLNWTETGTSTKADLNDEEGWTLLPSGDVLTVDCYTDFTFGLISSYPANPVNSESYDPATGEWSSAGSTIQTLTDPVLSETGPAVLRPDGSVMAVGSSGDTSIYNSDAGIWTLGPTLPLSAEGYQFTAQDAPGVLLPDGNVLVGASGGPETATSGDYSAPPVAFFEFNGQRFVTEPTIPNAANDPSYSVSLLLLPTGQVLEVDGTNDIEIYTPSNLSNNPAWAPVIIASPPVVSPGASYPLQGVRFNGMSQACMFGDEHQCATNYPLVRIINSRTKHVFYSRTHDHSSMAVASNLLVSTHFDVPAGQERGPSVLQVVANGIASRPVVVKVK
jgi:hypothetical protein